MTKTTREDRDILRILIHGTTAFEILRTAVELRIFDTIEAAGGLDLPGLAAALGIAEQPARILLLGLTSLRLVKKEGARYENTEITRDKLLRSSRRNVLPLLEIQSRIINPSMVDLAASARAGTNVGLRHIPGEGATLYQRLAADPERQKVFYDNMSDVSAKTFPFVLEMFDFGKLRHLVDLGGGDGTNAIVLAKRHPHLQVTVFDEESVCAVAAENIARAGLEGRVRVHAGDVFTDPLPRGIDGVLYLHMFEVWSLEKNRAMLARCKKALSPGGAALVYNFVSKDDGTGPLAAAFMSAYFLALSSGEGMVYSAADMEATVMEAGFQRTERFEGGPFDHALVVGWA